MIWLKAMTTMVLSHEITKIWKIHGVPQKILSNREPQFASWFIKDLTKPLGTRRILSTVYHPQTDGQTEQINQEVEAFLWYYINY